MSKYSMKAKRKWAEQIVQIGHEIWQIKNNTLSYHYDEDGLYEYREIDLEKESVILEHGISDATKLDYRSRQEGIVEHYESHNWGGDAYGHIIGEPTTLTNTSMKWVISLDKFLSLVSALLYYDNFEAVYKCSPIEQYETIDNDIIYTNIINSDTLKTDVTVPDWDELTIYTVDTHFPIITFEKIKNTEEYTFLVDIKDIDDFKYRTVIKTKQDLNEAIDFTVKAFEDSKVFNKYVDDIKKLKL